MKTKILIFAVLISLTFIACQKEEESENPYSNGVTGETYNLSSEDMSYFPYKENDSLAFIEKYNNNLEGEGYIKYFYTSQIETGYEELNGNKYQYYQVRFGNKDQHDDYWTFRLQKTKAGINHTVKKSNDYFTPTLIYELKEFEAFYPTIVLDSTEYTNVYYYVYKTVGDFWNDTTMYEKYYFAKDIGIVTFKDPFNYYFRNK